MKVTITTVLIFLSAFLGNVFAGLISEIELLDGGVVLGEIICYNGDAYTVRSNSLGTLRVKESEIRMIHPRPGSSMEKQVKGPEGHPFNPEMQSLQNSIMNDKEIMSRVLALQNNPEIQAILKNPSIMQAINSGDISALMSNPRFMEILNNPGVIEIQKRILSPGSSNQ